MPSKLVGESPPKVVSLAGLPKLRDKYASLDSSVSDQSDDVPNDYSSRSLGFQNSRSVSKHSVGARSSKSARTSKDKPSADRASSKASPKSATEVYLRLTEGIAPNYLSEAGFTEDERATETIDDQRLIQLGTTSINQLLGRMTQTLQIERARHSADVSLRMRKVTKDLQFTFKSIQQAFALLTRRLSALAKEVQESQQLVAVFKERFDKTKDAAEAQYQYVKELETVLEGQGDGLSKVLKRLSSSEVDSRQKLEKLQSGTREREAKLQKEIDRLRTRVAELDNELKDQSSGGGMAPPAMPEAPSTWTLTTPQSSANGRGSASGAFPCGGSATDRAVTAPNDVASALPGVVGATSRPFTCEAASWRPTGNASRVRAVRGTQSLRKSGSAQMSASNASLTEAEADQVDFLREELALWQARCEDAEAREDRTRRLLDFSRGSQLLLQQVFEDLRQSRHLTADAEGTQSPLRPEDPATVLERITKHFHTAIPKLGSYPDLLTALEAEKNISAAAVAKTRSMNRNNSGAPSGAPSSKPEDEDGFSDEEDEPLSGRSGSFASHRDSLQTVPRASLLSTFVEQSRSFGRRRSSASSAYGDMFGTAELNIQSSNLRRSSMRSSFGD